MINIGTGWAGLWLVSFILGVHLINGNPEVEPRAITLADLASERRVDARLARRVGGREFGEAGRAARRVARRLVRGAVEAKVGRLVEGRKEGRKEGRNEGSRPPREGDLSMRFLLFLFCQESVRRYIEGAGGDSEVAV